MRPPSEKQTVEPAPTGPPAEVFVATTVSKSGCGEVKVLEPTVIVKRQASEFANYQEVPSEVAIDGDYDLSHSGVPEAPP
ncbi:hypothetical protein IscW_ISCW018270 [Ixodes scapularis]|uniref:Uncharacterized protein n=1 Tax=Ixodes scapularis TaxID=6945 RepID=B7PK13_IXOSC|nr:hypothetical protein IscW_ISCW018270 [Ixodes scapularis]|eukprot:XP_002409098.1 hypothetical protein IscW_ISCW018270 [Ixodes scapularis]